jgi:AcrR family transcriptional regulator
MKRKKKKLPAADRRAQLLTVARGVFAKAGFDSASMDEIARLAGVSKPILYEHFGGKEGLYAVIVDREMQALTDRVVARIATGSPRKRWEGAVIACLAYAKEQPDGFAVLTRDPPPGQTRRAITNVIRDLSERVRVIFEEELDRVGLDSRVSGLYAHALIGAVTEAAQWWVDNRTMDVDDVARHVAAISWMGLRHLPKKPQLLP